MSTSERVAEHHLSRTAIIYIRQSSPHQVLTNQESLRLQYALRQRAEASYAVCRQSRSSELL